MFSPDAVELPANFGKCEARFENDPHDLARSIGATVGETGLRELLRIYYAQVRLVDDQVGRILDSLDRTGRTEHTIVVFTSDHGDMAGGHGMFEKSTSAFYEEIVRVPLIISYPHRIKPGANSMAVSSADLMPTLMELTTTKCPTKVEGSSLAPILLGEKARAPKRQYGLCERISPNKERSRQFLPGQRGSFMIRGEGWKYIRYTDGGEYLYHLAKDPGEIRNLSDVTAYRGTKNHLAGELNDWLEQTHCPPFIAKS